MSAPTKHLFAVSVDPPRSLNMISKIAGFKTLKKREIRIFYAFRKWGELATL